MRLYCIWVFWVFICFVLLLPSHLRWSGFGRPQRCWSTRLRREQSRGSWEGTSDNALPIVSRKCGRRCYCLFGRLSIEPCFVFAPPVTTNCRTKQAGSATSVFTTVTTETVAAEWRQPLREKNPKQTVNKSPKACNPDSRNSINLRLFWSGEMGSVIMYYVLVGSDCEREEVPLLCTFTPI